MAPSYHSKVTSTQNKGVPLSQSFSDNSNLIILANIRRLHENGKWILCVSNRFMFCLKEAFLLLHTVFLNCFLLNSFWWWYLCHFCFLLSTFTWWYFSEKFCNVALSLYWLSFVWFYTNEQFRDQKSKMVWLPIIF